MLEYGTMSRWSRTHDLLLNRAAMVNQIHGCAYDWGVGNPCRVYWDSLGSYVCEYAGDVLCRWALYDVAAVDAALRAVDALADTLWRVRKGGFLRVMVSC